MEDYSVFQLKEHYDIHGLPNVSFLFLSNISLHYLMLGQAEHDSVHVWPYFFWLTFTVGILGNGLVIAVYCRSKEMKTVTNTYLFNLSISDILYLMSVIPYNSAWIEQWPLGEFLCKFFGYLMNVTTTLGILTLTAVGVDRHNAVIYPISSRNHRTMRKTVIIIVTIWLFSSAVSSPTLIIARNIRMIGFDVCMYSWREKWMHKVYSSTMFILFYAAPQIVLCACYRRIGSKLWFSVPTSGPTNGAAIRKLQNGRRVVKMAAIVTVSFVVCWLPVNVMELLMAFEANITTAFHDLKVLAPLIPHFCIAANPFVYNFMSKTFHKHLKETILCFCKPARVCRSVDRTIDTVDDVNPTETFRLQIRR